MNKLVGRFLSGMAWGAAATIVLSLVRPSQGNPKQMARGLIKGVLSIADVTAEARETLEDLYAEVRTEQEGELA
jgi:hypothetical protein